jgi:membrane fusion protein (multidrug efflux system)
MLSRGARRAGGLSVPLLLACVSAVPGCSSDHAGESKPAAPARTDEASAGRPPVPVRVSTPVPVEDDDTYPSNLYVERDVWVAARSTGVIEQVLVERGQRVREGQPLFVLEDDLQKVELKIAEHALAYHEAEYARTKELYEQNIVSSLEALRDETNRNLAASELERAKALLERCTVRAPFDGVVVERLAVRGQRVVEDEAAQLVRLVGADDRRRARIHVPEQRLAALAVGQPATILVERAAHPARILFVSPAVDAASDTGLVIVEAARSDSALRVGAGVDVRLAERAPVAGELYRVPREAFGSRPIEVGSPARLLVAAQGQAAERRVDVVAVDAAEATVRGGLEPTDLVILAGAAQLSPGDPVDVRGRRP